MAPCLLVGSGRSIKLRSLGAESESRRCAVSILGNSMEFLKELNSEKRMMVTNVTTELPSQAE